MITMIQVLIITKALRWFDWPMTASARDLNNVNIIYTLPGDLQVIENIDRVSELGCTSRANGCLRTQVPWARDSLARGLKGGWHDGARRSLVHKKKCMSSVQEFMNNAATKEGNDWHVVLLCETRYNNWKGCHLDFFCGNMCEVFSSLTIIYWCNTPLRLSSLLLESALYTLKRGLSFFFLPTLSLSHTKDRLCYCFNFFSIFCH